MMGGDAELTDLYRDVLLDYFRSQTHKGKLAPADFHSHGVNPVCGDEVELTMNRRDDKIDQIRYIGHGCVISQASAAMMAEALEGQTMARVKEHIESFRDVMLHHAPLEKLPEVLDEIRALEGVRKFPMRVKCALLPWNTLKLGLESGASGNHLAEYQETEKI